MDDNKTSLSATKWDGCPPNMQEDGWHWLRLRRTGALAVWEWDANDECWLSDTCHCPHDMARHCSYYAKAVPPAEPDTL